MDKDLIMKLQTAIASMSDMLSKLQEAMPGDAAEEQSETIDEATEEETAGTALDPTTDGSGEDEGAQPDMTDETAAPADVEGGEEDDQAKRVKKAAAIAMLKKSLPA